MESLYSDFWSAINVPSIDPVVQSIHLLQYFTNCSIARDMMHLVILLQIWLGNMFCRASEVVISRWFSRYFSISWCTWRSVNDNVVLGFTCRLYLRPAAYTVYLHLSEPCLYLSWSRGGGSILPWQLVWLAAPRGVDVWQPGCMCPRRPGFGVSGDDDKAPTTGALHTDWDGEVIQNDPRGWPEEVICNPLGLRRS